MAKQEAGKLGELRIAARMMGKKGGKRGGPARARKLTARRRSQIARLGYDAMRRNAGAKD